MKKTLFFVVIVLALFCFISCDHLSSVKYDVSGSNLVDSLNGKITSDGTSISLVFPAFPGAASRDADPDVNENQHFHVTLIAEPDFIESKEGCAGETVTFENLTPGDYSLKCTAWDDDSGLRFTGTQDVTVQVGNNEVELVMDFVTEDDHIKLEPTANGVNITIKGIDFSEINGVSVYEYSSGTRFFLDESKKAEITAGGKDTYTFIWPFAPSKVNGKKCNYYVFRCETVNTDNTVKEEIVCCDKKDTLTSIDFTNFDKIKMKYEENGNARNVFFDTISLNTLRWTVTNAVSESRIDKFSALMELFAYDSGKDEVEWIDTNVIDLPVSGTFVPQENDDFEQNCDNLFKGNKVNFLDFAGADADTVNTTLTEYGKVIPNFIWRFTMTDIPYGSFELHPINGQFPYTPITPDDITAPVILTILGYGDPEENEGGTFARICAEFEAANPLIDIQYECKCDEDYHHRVSERLASGDIPDIAYMGADVRWGEPWKNAGQQIDNTPYMPSNIDKNLIPDFYGTGMKPYIPLGGSNFCTVIGVNMQLLEEIGGTLPTTYDEFKTLAGLCQEHEKKCLITQGSDAWVWGSCVMSGIIPRTTGNLKWVQDAVTGKEHFTDDDFVAALNVLSQWVTDGILDSGSVNYSNSDARDVFCSGEALMIINGQWEFAEQNYGDLSEHMRLIPIPPVPGQTGCGDSIAGAWQGGYGITRKGATSSDPNVLKAAKKWLTYFYSKEETAERLNDGSISYPIITDFDYTDFNNLVWQKALLGMYPICDVIDSYLSGDANDTLNAGMMAIVQGTKTAATVAAEVQAAFDAQ